MRERLRRKCLRLAVFTTRAWTSSHSRMRLARRRSRDVVIARERPWPRIVPVASLPKAGGTWLAELLAEVPGYAGRRYRDADRCTLEHDVCAGVFESLPSDRLSVIKLHTRPSPANVELFERLGLKAVVLHRDLRDQCVSRMYHVLADPFHRHNGLYTELPPEEALSHSIALTLDEYVPWVAGWRELTKRSGLFLELRYEDLRAAPAETLGRVLRFFEIDLAAGTPEAIVERVSSRTRFSLSPRTLATGATARRGVVGEWRNHFGPQHVAQFRAGMRDFSGASGSGAGADTPRHRSARSRSAPRSRA
jgi:hypothetical protein